MLRIIGFHLAVFAAPFLLYAVYLVATERTFPGRDAFPARVLSWLVAAGLALTIIAFVIVAAVTGEEPGGIYQPAELRDGQVVPGRIVRPDAEPGE